MEYLYKMPHTIPEGKILVHNYVVPTRRLGSRTRGFRVWLDNPTTITTSSVIAVGRQSSVITTELGRSRARRFGMKTRLPMHGTADLPQTIRGPPGWVETSAHAAERSLLLSALAP
jgi:hypothetical protein